ncbi:MAG: hypothetical protein JSV03_06380 [Planctomycetota bacterium]|nr:MAG: hypothetical protein JSV03_06380 [Planctomycetota bacterium]
MMKTLVKCICAAVVLTMASAAFGQLDFFDNFNSYQAYKKLNDGPWAPCHHFNYEAPYVWGHYERPPWGGPKRGKSVSKPNNLLINQRDQRWLNGVQALLADGKEYNGSDKCPLEMSYFAWYGKVATADFYVVISLGDVHPPASSSVVLPQPMPCIAFCKPYFERSRRGWYFDGKQWTSPGNCHPKDGKAEFSHITIETEDCRMRFNDGMPNNVELGRAYQGGFDRISLYTVKYEHDQWVSLDDVSVEGGYTTLIADLDILPEDDPNYLTNHTGDKSRLPIALLSTEDVDVTQIELDSISIGGTIFPVKTPKVSDENGDGLDDLKLHFSRREVIITLGLDLMETGTVVPITVIGELGCDSLEATDTIIVQERED